MLVSGATVTLEEHGAAGTSPPPSPARCSIPLAIPRASSSRARPITGWRSRARPATGAPASCSTSDGHCPPQCHESSTLLRPSPRLRCARSSACDQFRWRLPREGGMRVDGIVYADEQMMTDIRKDESLQQVANVAHLPGIVGASHRDARHPLGLRLPDRRRGGDRRRTTGVVSPGGVGYDINCGVRLLRSTLDAATSSRRTLEALVDAALPQHPDRRRRAPRRDLRLSGKRPARACSREGAAGRSAQGLGARATISSTLEERGCIAGADPDQVSERAASAAQTQLGTLGSGNHFVEVQYVAEIYDERTAARLRAGAGSGHGDDPHRLARARPPGLHRSPARRCGDAAAQYGITLPDRQLACAPLGLARRAALPRRDGGGRQLRLRQPPGDDALGARGVAARARHRRRPRRHRRGLRRLPQHRQVRDATTVDGEPRRRLRAPQGRDPRLPPGPPGTSRRTTATSASRCSSPATWGATRYVWPAPQRAMRRDLRLDLPRRRPAA